MLRLAGEEGVVEVVEDWCKHTGGTDTVAGTVVDTVDTDAFVGSTLNTTELQDLTLQVWWWRWLQVPTLQALQVVSAAGRGVLVLSVQKNLGPGQVGGELGSP